MNMVAVEWPELTLDCIRSATPPADLREAWDNFVADEGAEIYFTTDWLAAWWANYGPSWSPSRSPATLVIRDNGRLVGILPFCIETIRIGPFPVRFARLAGVDPNFSVVTLPLARGQEHRVLAKAIGELTGPIGCDAVCLSPLSNRSNHLEAVRDLVKNCSSVDLVRDRSDRSHTIMNLPETAEDFFAGLSKSRRREHRRDLKQLSEMGNLSNRSATGQDVDEAMDRFVTQHTSQWQAADKGGHFADWSVAEAFYRDLLHRLAPEGHAALDEQWLGGALLSSQLRFNLGSKAYWWLNSRSLDPQHRTFGLGRIGLVERVGDLIQGGIRSVEAGAGEYEYKLSYGGELIPVQSIVFASKRPIAKFRSKMLLLLSDTLHLLYYRIWFLRLLPRLRRIGVGPRSLWKSWIRTRL